MGIGGSIIDHSFMEEYLGMRVESVDEVEILRRMEEGIYNEEEYQKALAKRQSTQSNFVVRMDTFGMESNGIDWFVRGIYIRKS